MIIIIAYIAQRHFDILTLTCFVFCCFVLIPTGVAINFGMNHVSVLLLYTFHELILGIGKLALQAYFTTTDKYAISDCGRELNQKRNAR